MGDNYWEPTIEAFQGYITKPKLDEKLLKRPPFLYILQLFIEVRKVSGLGKTLFPDEELTKAYYTSGEKEVNIKRKEMFFKKLLKLVSLVVSSKPAAMPLKILQGKEAEKTNLFLQDLAKAAKSDKDPAPYEQKLLDALARKEREKEEADMPEARKGGTSNPQNQQEEQPKAAEVEPERKRDHNQREAQESNQPSSKFTRDVEDQLNQEQGARKKEEDKGRIKMGNLRRGRNAKPNAKSSERNSKKEQAQDDGSEHLKELIQKITQSSNPLGKIIEFVDDDIESISKEYQYWTRAYKDTKEKLKDKEKESETQLQTYKDKITNKEEQIREKKGQIESIKTQILRNSQKIEKLLNGIVGGTA